MEHFSRVQVFLESFQDVLGRLSAPREDHLVARTDLSGRNPEARTMADRVLILMREIGRPVQPKAVATEYERRRWPMPRAGTVYGAVNSAMNYLLHRRAVLQRNEQGYFLPDQILSDSVSGKKAGRATRA
jgi:hypothetical protein